MLFCSAKNSKSLLVIVLTLGLTFSLTACNEEEVVDLPPAAPLTHEAIGYYCNMTVAEHPGPKGQIKLQGQSKPVWFSSVRDTIAFTLLPEEPKNIAAIYVTDMPKADTWEKPGTGKWIEAKSAMFVTGSNKKGGMGAPEAVPFSTKAAADKFAEQFGGKVVAFSEIPKSSILGAVEVGSQHHVKNETVNQDTSKSHEKKMDPGTSMNHNGHGK